MSNTKAEIKDKLPVIWASNKFAMYIMGKQLKVKTDHEPMVSLLGSRHLVTYFLTYFAFPQVFPTFDYSNSYIVKKHLCIIYKN
jgi:hypothetical protein